MIDVHGAGSIDWWGGRGAEIYNNTIYAAEGYNFSRAIDYRGGGGVVFNNTIINCSVGVNLSHDAEQLVCWIKDLWIWNNTYQMLQSQYIIIIHLHHMKKKFTISLEKNLDIHL